MRKLSKISPQPRPPLKSTGMRLAGCLLYIRYAFCPAVYFIQLVGLFPAYGNYPRVNVIPPPVSVIAHRVALILMILVLLQGNSISTLIPLRSVTSASE